MAEYVNNQPLPEGSVIGMLGGGQLGMFFAQAATSQGYQTHIYTPEEDSPASRFAEHTTVASFNDSTALATFASSVDVITLEFENIPLEAIDCLSRLKPVIPNRLTLETAQNRLNEKTLVNNLGFNVTPFKAVNSLEEFEKAFEAMGPGVLKTNTLGYDGKGQHRIKELADITPLENVIANKDWVYEQWVNFQTECSIIGCRSLNGEFVALGPFENHHQNGILHKTLAPVDTLASIESNAINMVKTTMEKLDTYGLLCIEFFVTNDNQLIFNEMAPRPHNSGHLTLDACYDNQFDYHVKAVSGQPLPEPLFEQAAVMVNLLGDCWPENGEPDWSAVKNTPNAYLHLYGKTDARPGRKMGHLTVCNTSLNETPQHIEAMLDSLKRSV